MTIHLAIQIQAPAPKIFKIIADLENYDQWLPNSSAFKGTTEVSEKPARLGTTYTEYSPHGVRRGSIVEFEDPKKITFSQPMSFRPLALGIRLDVKVTMTLREEGNITYLERDITLGYPWSLWPMKVYLDNEFRKESLRTIELLKKYAES